MTGCAKHGREGCDECYLEATLGDIIPVGKVSTRALVRSCERVEVTRVVVKEGAGTNGDPVREASYWYDDDGWLIARRDSWEENQSGGLGAPPT